ncbi:1406_t:CDS:2, partial [Entrophospora sp. SA101]
IFLGANEPHAYLSGECMAASDNVVRAGLTPINAWMTNFMRHDAKDFASEISLAFVSGNELYLPFQDFDENLILQEQRTCKRGDKSEFT